MDSKTPVVASTKGSRRGKSGKKSKGAGKITIQVPNETSTTSVEGSVCAEHILNPTARAASSSSKNTASDSYTPVTTTADTKTGEKKTGLPKYIRLLAEDLMSKDIERQIVSTTALRKLLSIEKNPPIQEVIDGGVVSRLVEFLTYDHSTKLQAEAVWTLTNIASGTTAHTLTVIDVGAVSPLIRLLDSPNEDVKEQAVWALGNIAGDSYECRIIVLTANVLLPLLRVYTPTTRVTTLRIATWTLSNLCRGRPYPPFELVAPALGVLRDLIWSTDEQVLAEACWTLSHLSDDCGSENKQIQAVIEAGVCERLVQLLAYPLVTFAGVGVCASSAHPLCSFRSLNLSRHESIRVVTPTLKTVGNLLTGNDSQTQVLVDLNVLPRLKALLSHSKKRIRKDVCWIISNITAGTVEQIQAVIDADIIAPVVSILKCGDIKLQSDAAWTISNAMVGGEEGQIRSLMKHDIMGPLCDLLTCSDSTIVRMVLDALPNILHVGQLGIEGVNRYAFLMDECGGVDKLDMLQNHENDQISQKAVNILHNYFEREEASELAVDSSFPL